MLTSKHIQKKLHTDIDKYTHASRQAKGPQESIVSIDAYVR